MKKLTLLAALVCGASFSSMAADNGSKLAANPILKTSPLADKSIGTKSEIKQVLSSAFFDYDCELYTLSCGLSGFVCGEDYERGWQVAIDDMLECGW